MKKGKLLGGALFVMIVTGVLLVVSVSVPEKAQDRTQDRAQEKQAPPPRTYQENLTERAPHQEAAEIAVVQPDSDPALGEAEMEHLSEVFLNSVYPLFQYEFQLDLESRAAIDVFVANMPDGLTSKGLDTISDMIETQLMGPEAEDLAFIITHLYRLEQEEARMMNEGPPVTTMQGQLEAQEQLSRLRDEWFGPELSDLLFNGADDASAMSDTATAESQPDGDSIEEQPQAQTEAQAELTDIESDWERRYQTFLSEKQVIDRAGLDQTEKDRQIEALLQQHYHTPQEVEAARAYGEEGGYE